MSDDDLLTEAMRALRESSDGEDRARSPQEPGASGVATAGQTRARILVRAQERTRQRRRVVFGLMPLAAALIVSTAWGAVTGRLPRWLDRVTGRAPSETSAPVGSIAAPLATVAPATPAPTVTAFEGSAQVAAGSAQVVPSSAQVVPSSAQVVPSSAPTSAAQPVTAPAVAVPSSVPSSAVTAARTAQAVSAQEQRVYGDAHRAHFVVRDPADALRGWDAYLAAYPDGRFALEARYNRAISLVRLGRRAEARAALAPFAEGKHQGYRQTEARELLDALSAADGGAEAR
jgi:hypothetical protein